MERLKKVIIFIADFFEVYLPIAAFVMLFIVFLTNVFFRYIVNNPQNWTFEFSVNSLVIVGLLGACTAYRREDHIVSDLVYVRVNAKIKNIFRIISHVFIIIFFSMAIPGTIRYLIKLRAVTPIMKIPYRIIFSAFPILLISTVLWSLYRLVMDVKTFKDKTYIQLYNTDEKETTI
ncbi:MAG: Tripartite ATP-independent periplasmic transporter DctQ component [candidate division TA06 bacterium 34_109]|uniref:Tripartite ATP-independent periplasmic transporter DctQ component n=1 Tax=candidate division TA06 bacterium 34_109 TaxID=1635277 RepID=A0A101I0D1_UNCT6|nr:MAG: Tripartite ATP-independent periplasmic transporter DctQ component [candidate division TA06 bacterium 34_109]